MKKLNITLLTDDVEKAEICSAYWEIDGDGEFVHKVGELAEIADVRPCDITQLVKTHTKVILDAFFCERCDKPRLIQSRSEYLSAELAWICEDCLESRLQDLRRKQRNEYEHKRELIILEYGDSLPASRRIEELSLFHAVYMLSLMRLLLSEDMKILVPIDSCNGSFAPFDLYETDILRQLFRNKWIYVDVNSDIDAFDFESGHLDSFYWTKVSWLFPYLQCSDDAIIHPLHGITQALRNEVWPQDWLGQRLELWKNIALNEALQYLVESLRKHDLPFEPGPKTNMVLSQILENYSVSQCYNFIWRAVRDAAAYYMRESIPKQRAANSVIGSIQRSAERAYTEGWDIKGYERIFECPQTTLSDITYNLVLGIGEQGFKLPPIEKHIPK